MANVESYGMFVAMSTFSASEACTNMLRTKGQKMTIGFGASMANIGEIAPSASWFTSATDSGWIRAVSNDNVPRRVVFVGGLYFRWPHRLFGEVRSPPTTVIK